MTTRDIAAVLDKRGYRVVDKRFIRTYAVDRMIDDLERRLCVMDAEAYMHHDIQHMGRTLMSYLIANNHVRVENLHGRLGAGVRRQLSITVISE